MILKADPANPNRLDADTKAVMAKSLAEFGDLGGIVFNRRTGLLVGGHQRTDVLKDGRLDVVDLPSPEPDGTVARGHIECYGRRFSVRVVDWSEDKAHAALLAANRFGRLGKDDSALLKDLLEVLDCGQKTDDGQLLADLTGYDAKAREELMLQIHQDEDADAEPQISRAKELQEKWGTERGQLWAIGDHRLLCGDSTSAEDVRRVMDGMQSDMIFTDPPYGVAYVGKTKDALTVENDDVSEDVLSEMCRAWFDLAQEVCRLGAYWLATVPAGPLHKVFLDDWKRRGILRQIMVWNKDSMVLGHSEYHYKHEPILFGWIQGGQRRKNEDRTKTTVWDFPRPKASREHPTMKPVEMWEYGIKNHTDVGNLIYEPFLGSGTTMVAAQNLGRKCYGLELNPAYVAVILERMQTAFPSIEIRKAD